MTKSTAGSVEGGWHIDAEQFAYAARVTATGSVYRSTWPARYRHCWSLLLTRLTRQSHRLPKLYLTSPQTVPVHSTSELSASLADTSTSPSQHHEQDMTYLLGLQEAP
jgi:hypothetical protein